MASRFVSIGFTFSKNLKGLKGLKITHRNGTEEDNAHYNIFLVSVNCRCNPNPEIQVSVFVPRPHHNPQVLGLPSPSILFCRQIIEGVMR